MSGLNKAAQVTGEQMKVVLNPDQDYVAEIRERIKSNNGHCPCSVEKNKDTKCMCKEFREQIDRAEPGYCHCELYYVEE